MSTDIFKKMIFMHERIDKGEYSEALRDLNKIIKDINEQPIMHALTLAQVAIIYVHRAECLRSLGCYKEAQDDCNLAIINNPNLADAYYLRGLCGAQKGEHTHQTLNDFLKAEDLGYIEKIDLYGNIGACSNHLNLYDNAIKYLSKAIDLWENLDENNIKTQYRLKEISKFYYTRAYAYHILNIKNNYQFRKQFSTDLNMAIELDPENIDAFWMRGLSQTPVDGFYDTKRAINITFKNLANDYFNKFQNNNQTFFLFMSINKNNLAALANNYIWCSDPKNFNDPLDAAPLRDYINDYASRFPLVETIFNMIRIRALAAYDIADNASKNTLLWSHYAKNHTGMMVEIEFHKEQMAKHHIGIGEVLYEETINVAEEHPQINIKAYCFTKTKMWEYESEHRLIALSDDLEGGNKLPSECFKIKSITFGLKTTQEHKVAVKKIYQNPNCTYYEMYQNDEEKKTSPFIVHRRLCK